MYQINRQLAKQSRRAKKQSENSRDRHSVWLNVCKLKQLSHIVGKYTRVSVTSTKSNEYKRSEPVRKSPKR